MPDISDFTAVTQETIETIRARMDADVNAGLDPSDPRWVDTTEGSIYFDLTQPVALEQERLWDMIGTEVPAAMFPSYAWGDFLDEHALTYGLVRKDAIAATGTVRFTGTPGTLIPTGTQVGTVTTDPDADSIVYQTTAGGTLDISGMADVPAAALEVGADSNIAVGVITLLLTPIDGIASVSNITAMSSGEDQEGDVDLQARVLIEISSTVGAGTSDDYVRWGLAYPGVGNVTVIPLWAGGGTVRVVVTDTNNDPVSSGIVAGLQAVLDPTSAPGMGQGLAPIGAIVTVATPNLYYVDFETSLIFNSGYSLDGTSGTIAVRDAVVAAVTAYVDAIPAGQEVVINRCEAACLSVAGVHDCAGSELGGYLTFANALAQASPDRATSIFNLPVPSTSIASLVRVDL